MKEFPSKIEIDLVTKKEKVEYVSLTDEEYDKQIIQPLAQVFFDLIQHDIESGKLNPNELNKK